MNSLLLLLIEHYSFETQSISLDRRSQHHQDESWQEPSTQQIPIVAITDKTIENELIVSII